MEQQGIMSPNRISLKTMIYSKFKRIGFRILSKSIA